MHLLPAANVFLEPELDAHNRAPAGRALVVPIRVDQRSPANKLTELAVDVSYHGGMSRQPSRIAPARDGWRTLLTPPRGAGHVSVRARTADTAGNTSEQTVIRGWELV